MNTRKIAVEYRLSHWANIMQKRSESGLSVREFCEQEGFHENIYFYWQRKLREAACGQQIGLQAIDKQTGLAPTGFTEVKLQDLSGRTSMSGAAGKSELCFDVTGFRFVAGSDYPTENIVALLRRLTQP